MSAVAWFQILTGVGIAGIWTVLLTTGRVPEIAAGTRDIWFHLAAELATAAVLVSAGVILLTTTGTTARLYAALGLGALTYTTVNSAGYYADADQWPAVATFAALTLASLTATVVLVAA